MTSKDKLIKKVESRDARNSLSFRELVRYIEYFGFIGKESKTNGGSHYVFRNSIYSDIDHIVLPMHKGSMLMVYRNKCIKGVNKVREKEKNDGKL